nr:integrase, catalytic region, zinc finger, CCHC-type, peptidase aspartic, catalytic [Tanacetum cinerariifolium]
MANLSEDIQCAGSDTRPPMLDRTDFASWQQRIRLYCRGKENGINILKSIDEGPFHMGTLRETLTKGTEGALHLGPEQPRVYSDLTSEEMDMYNADIRATNIWTKSKQNRTENEKRGRAQQCQSPVTVEKAEKRRNTDSRDQYWQILEVVLIQE